MVKYSYKIVSQVFENHESAALRDDCLKNGTFERFIERIGQLSSEKKRVRVDKVEKVEEETKKDEKKEEMIKQNKKKSKKEKKD